MNFPAYTRVESDAIPFLREYMKPWEAPVQDYFSNEALANCVFVVFTSAEVLWEFIYDPRSKEKEILAKLRFKNPI